MKADRSSRKHPNDSGTRRPVYPFAAIVGQEEMKLGLLLNVIDPRIGGALIMGHRGTGKSTAVRALADLLPGLWRVRGCLYGCDPSDEESLCDECAQRLALGERLERERASVPVVDLPLGATEDRVCGSINIERALKEGVKAFEPGLLARANRGFLYIDEVNLLEDHLVDLLLDTAATGYNRVERESVSVEHPARFVLIGSGNPEEGELRPQLLDRFGLHVEIRTSEDVDERLMIVERRDAFERDPAGFRAGWEAEQMKLRRRIMQARKRVSNLKIERGLLRKIAELCLHLKVDGHRGELTVSRAARALAAFEGGREVTSEDVERVASMSLRHRLRRDPLEQTPGGARIEEALERLFHSDSEEIKRKTSGQNDSEPDDFSNRGGKGSSNAGGNGSQPLESRMEQSAPIEAGAKLSEQNQPKSNGPAKSYRPDASARRPRGGAKAVYNSRRGRYTRSVQDASPGARLALDATLRAALTIGARLENTFSIPAGALRYKRFSRKTGALFIFAIDTSGSMALNRIRQAKGALLHLLEQSYIRRDEVALISFRGEGAEIALPPSRSMARARRILDELAVGGATPLASGLEASLRLARRAAAPAGERRILLFLFTDGRANVPLKTGLVEKRMRRQVIERELEHLGAALIEAKVETVVVDTQNRFTSQGEGRELAAALRGRYIFLPVTGAAPAQARSFKDSINQ